MGFTLDDLGNKDKKELEYRFDDGDVFKYSVSVNKMNFEMVSRLTKAANQLAALAEAGADDVTQEHEEAVVLFLELVVQWDLVDNEGNMAPITESNVKRIPMPMLGSMIERIMEQISPNPTKETSSSDGSKTQKSPKQKRTSDEASLSRIG